jgi:hypothetical protein
MWTCPEPLRRIFAILDDNRHYYTHQAYEPQHTFSNPIAEMIRNHKIRLCHRAHGRSIALQDGPRDAPCPHNDEVPNERP